MIRTVGEIKEILKDVEDDATFVFSVDVSTGEEDKHNRLQSDFVEIGVERKTPSKESRVLRVIFSLFDMNKNFIED